MRGDEVFWIVNWRVNDVTMQMAETEDKALYSTGRWAATFLEPNGFELNDAITTGTTGNVNMIVTATPHSILTANCAGKSISRRMQVSLWTQSSRR